MNFNQLYAFYIVAQEGSFTSAAKRMAVSQPAVTKHIRELENFFGIRLFERTARRTLLTDAGGRLLPFAQRVFALADEAEGTLRELAGLKSGRLQIGTSRTIGSYYMPSIVVQFKQLYPGVILSVHIENSQWVLERILTFDIDLGILGIRPKHEHLTVLPFVQEELVLVVSPSHPWAHRRAVAVEELEQQPLIVREPGSGTRQLIEGELQRVGVWPEITMEIGSNGAIKRAVERGVGLALFPPIVVASEVEAGQLRALRVRGADLVLSFNVVHHRDKGSSRLVQAFLEVVASTG